MTINFDKGMAYAIAVRYTGLTDQAPHLISNLFDNGIYHLIINTINERHEIDVDSFGGTILGHRFSPLNAMA